MIDKSLNKIKKIPKTKRTTKNYLNNFSILAVHVTVAIGKQSVLAYTLPPLADTLDVQSIIRPLRKEHLSIRHSKSSWSCTCISHNIHNMHPAGQHNYR